MKFFRDLCTGWSYVEIAWLIICPALILGISVHLGGTVISTVAAVTGVLYTLLAGKGKIFCYPVGVVNVICYSIASWQSKLYGEVMLNMGYYLPMMFVGLWCWKKHIAGNSVIVKTTLSAVGRVVTAFASVCGIALYALLLHRLGDAQPVVDSLTTVLSVAAMVLTVKRCIEQWILWMIVNAASVYMWAMAARQGNGSIALLVMWLIFLVNAMVFFLRWLPEIGKTEQKSACDTQ